MSTPQIINQLVPSTLVSDRDIDFELQVSSISLLSILNLLKSHTLTQMKNLMEITAVDTSNILRFYVTYFLESTHYNTRGRVSVQINELMPLISITIVFNSINGYEREAYDMYGLMFMNHPDLRRILTDYGFQGFPLRKDFPLSGFTDVFYDDGRKLLVYEPVTLAQNFRKFSFLSPGIQDK